MQPCACTTTGGVISEPGQPKLFSIIKVKKVEETHLVITVPSFRSAAP